MAFLNCSAFRPDGRWDQNAEMRELAMADNLIWVLQRESHRGKVLIFAHDLHLQTGVQVVGAQGKPVVGPWRRVQSTGSYLRSALGNDMIAIGTYYGNGVGFPHSNTPPADAHDVEDILASLAIPQFIIDLRELPSTEPLSGWFRMAHATGEDSYTIAPLEVYDVILNIDRITPSLPPK